MELESARAPREARAKFALKRFCFDSLVNRLSVCFAFFLVLTPHLYRTPSFASFSCGTGPLFVWSPSAFRDFRGKNRGGGELRYSASTPFLLVQFLPYFAKWAGKSELNKRWVGSQYEVGLNLIPRNVNTGSL